MGTASAGRAHAATEVRPVSPSLQYPSSVPSWARPRSPAPSSAVARSRPSSPAHMNGSSSDNKNSKHGHDASYTSGSENEDDAVDLALAFSAGCLHDEVYKASLPRWRYALRKILVKGVELESPHLANIQAAARAPFWDTYFIWTAIFGTHSAFMIGLPIFFWFGYAVEGRGLVNILAFGVYSSSVIKDLLCVPRPYAPPVARLSISSHGLEYGFPSTHSTNAVSLSLYAAELHWRSIQGTDQSWLNTVFFALCGIYAISVVSGRIYCGMHSMTDCLAGTLLGAAIWYSHMLYSPLYEAVLQKSGWTVPSIIVPLCLWLVFVHPEPVDDCPCFEDAIAFLATAAGIALGRWYNSNFSHLDFATHGRFTLEWAHVDELVTWICSAGFKLVIGIGAILLWRVIAKRTFHLVLPPLFRLFRPIIDLPRRHYLRATGYKQVEKHNPIHTVPSVLDLTDLSKRAQRHRASSVSTTTSSSRLAPPPNDFGRRKPTPVRVPATVPHATAVPASPASPTSPASPASPASSNGGGLPSPVKKTVGLHYDVEVLTKVGVYAGIGYIATMALPSLFRTLGLDKQ